MIAKAIADWFSNFLKGFVDMIVWAGSAHEYWNEPWAKGARAIIVGFAITWLGLKVVLEAWKMYVVREAGEQHKGPFVLFRNTIYAVCGIALSGWAVNWLWMVAMGVSQKVGAVKLTGDPKQMIEALVQSLMLMFQSGGLGLFVFWGIMCLVLYGFIFLIYLQSFIRGAELTLCFIFGPAFALSALTEDEPMTEGTLGVLCKELLVLTMTQVVQVALGLGVVANTIGTLGNLNNVLLAIPLAYVALKAPTYLRSYLYGSFRGTSISVMQIGGKVLGGITGGMGG